MKYPVTGLIGHLCKRKVRMDDKQWSEQKKRLEENKSNDRWSVGCLLVLWLILCLIYPLFFVSSLVIAGVCALYTLLSIS